MAKARKNTGTVVAKDAIVIVVGAKAPVYGTVKTQNRHTGEWVEIPNQNVVVDPGASGVSYAFKPMQKVSAGHPAVKDCPSAFMPIDEVPEEELDLLVTA